MVWFRPNNPLDRALHCAINEQNEARLAELLAKGADPDSRNRWGFTAREMARFLGLRSLNDGAPSVGRVKVRAKDDAHVRLITPKQFEQHFGCSYRSHLRFADYATFRRALRQCSLFAKYTSIGRERRWLGCLYAEDREQGRVADVSVRWIDEQMGYGLFAERPLEPFSFIGHYTGTVRQWSMWRQDQNAYCFHYPTGFWHFRIYMVDALHGGNETRFVNHADRPSAEAVTELDRGILHIFFRTKRRVEYGEEITIDYGKDYWMRRKKKKKSIPIDLIFIG